MTDIISNLSPFWGLALTTFSLIILGLTAYFMGRVLLSKYFDSSIETIGVNLFRANGVLLGLLLSMNFATVRSEYVKIQESVELGAKEITEISEDLKRYSSPEANNLLEQLGVYITVVIEEEWPILAKGQPHEKAWKMFNDLEDGILRLEPKSDEQALIKERMIKDIDELSDHRHTTMYSGNVSLNWFLFVVLVIFLSSSFFLSVYSVRRSTLIFFATYSGVIGVVLYSIVALNRPYQGLTYVSVEPLKIVSNQLMSVVKNE